MTERAITIEALNKTFEAIKRQGTTPRHDCRFDGHVEHFASTRCVYCAKVIRELAPDEKHVLLGEF